MSVPPEPPTDPTGAPSEPPDHGADPVLDRRRRLGHWARTAQRIGYALFGVAMVLFAVGFARGEFTPALVAGLEFCLLVGSLLLAPSIVVSHAVKAADRADRDDSWD